MVFLFFITADVVSLLIQAAGGGIASVASSNHKDSSVGTNIMIAGIAARCGDDNILGVLV